MVVFSVFLLKVFQKYKSLNFEWIQLSILDNTFRYLSPSFWIIILPLQQTFLWPSPVHCPCFQCKKGLCCEHMALFGSYLFIIIIFSNLQRCVSGPPQGDPPAVCHEEDKSSEPGSEEPDPTSFCGARHPHFCREPLCRLHVLLIWNTTSPLHGHGICRR